MARTTLDDRDRMLLAAPNFCHVATLRDDGTPHVVPTWIDVDSDRVTLNGTESRGWARRLTEQRAATLTVQNLENPYEYVSIRARLVERTRSGAEEHIDKMARKYLGLDTYPDHRADDPRVLLHLQPERVRRHGS